MRVPLFKDRPSFRPPRHAAGRRALIILAPTDADVVAVRSLGRALRRVGVDVVAASECHGEVRGERREPLLPNLLLIDAAGQAWDAVIVAGGRGASRVAEDALARQIVGRAASAGAPVAALGRGSVVLERAGVRGFLADDPAALGRWIAERLDLHPATGGRFSWLRRAARI